MVAARKATKSALTPGPKSLRSAEHRALCSLLIAERRKAGLKQADVAERLGKPQSYVAKYEGGERRLDVVEFIRVAVALGADPSRLLRALVHQTA
jgi:transcriptional regulator with XRE-family HTH domain